MKKLNRFSGMSRQTVALVAAASCAFAAHRVAADDIDGDASHHHEKNKVGDIFVIALENHNFTQPPTLAAVQQILGNSAAPYVNSLVTPGQPNASEVSYATAYFNAGNWSASLGT